MRIPLPSVDASPACSTRFVIISYTRAFEARYGFKPSLTVVDKGQAVQLSKKLGTEKNADLYIKAYLAMDDKWLEGQGKPLRLMSRAIQAISVSMQRANSAEGNNFIADEGAQELA